MLSKQRISSIPGNTKPAVVIKEAYPITCLRQIALHHVRGNETEKQKLIAQFDPADQERLNASLKNHKIKENIKPEAISAADDNRLMHSTPVSKWIIEWGRSFLNTATKLPCESLDLTDDILNTSFKSASAAKKS